MVVLHLQVPEVFEGPAALQQAEAEGVRIRELRAGDRGGVVQRTPQQLALAGQRQQPVAVMDGGAPVIAPRAVGATVEVHARQRRDAHVRQVAPGEQRGIHHHRRGLARSDREAVGARRVLPIQQRVQNQAAVAGPGALDPEAAEAWEQLRRRAARADRKSPGGQAVILRHDPPPGNSLRPGRRRTRRTLRAG